MTITETRPADSEPFDPRPFVPQTLAPPARAGWWAGTAVGLGVVAVAVALVALTVSLGSTGSTRPASASETSAQAAPVAAPAAATPPYGATDVAVNVAEFKVGLPATALTAGTKNLQITDAGTIQHEVLVFHPDASINPASLPLGPDGNVNEDAPGVNKISDGDNLDPGQTQTRQLDLTQPGTYVFVCNLPGHYRLGMWTTVTVH